MQTDSRLVYSTDASLNNRCPRCRELVSACTCASRQPRSSTPRLLPYVRLEKAHRGGKSVTVVDRLPASEDDLEKLAQHLKKKCGCGGTFKVTDGVGIIEIQGDKRTQVKSELAKLGIVCK